MKFTTDDEPVSDLIGYETDGFELRLYEAEMRYLSNLYKASKNPLYVWQATLVHAQYVRGAPLPAWCLDYFCDVSLKLQSLSRCSDFRIDYRICQPRQNLHSEAAQKLIPNALGLAGKQGKSLLRDYNSRALKGFELSLYENLRTNGVSKREATDILLRCSGREDERGLRRAFAESEIRIGRGGKVGRKAKKAKTSPRGSARAKAKPR